MTTPTGPSASTTSALSLLAPEQCATVLEHPRWPNIAALPDAAQQLAWLVEQGVLSYDELDDLQTFDQEPSERDRIVEATYALLGGGATQRTTAA
jgi:hypothetical protein